jgi:transcription-repair coupling factor (superfamily II helicase)
MLEEAVASLREGGGPAAEEQWSPQISIGMPVLIPEHYVEDLNLRLALYRRLSELTEDADIRAFAAELTDRFGPAPEEVEHLLKIVAIKALCRRANVEKIDAGPKGAVVAFRDNIFANPDGLVAWLARDVKDGSAKLRPDMRLVFRRDWATPEERLKGATALLRQMVKIAEAGVKAAA